MKWHQDKFDLKKVTTLKYYVILLLETPPGTSEEIYFSCN